jgi:hypothetical protein
MHLGGTKRNKCNKCASRFATKKAGSSAKQKSNTIKNNRLNNGTLIQDILAGESSFDRIRLRNALYIDKTKQIYNYNNRHNSHRGGHDNRHHNRRGRF